MFGRSDAPVGGARPNTSEEDDLVPAGVVERLDGFTPAVLILVVEVLDVELFVDNFVLVDVDDEEDDEFDFSLDSDFCFC